MCMCVCACMRVRVWVCVCAFEGRLLWRTDHLDWFSAGKRTWVPLHFQL